MMFSQRSLGAVPVVLIVMSVGVMLLAGLERGTVLAELAEDPIKGASRLWLRYGMQENVCVEPELGRDGAALLDALGSAEKFANPGLLRASEWAIFNVVRAFCCTPPDLTYGPLQIRYSKFRRHRTSDADDIFDLCDSRRIARRLLETELRFTFSPSQQLSRATVLEAARRYNGQRLTQHQSLERVLANVVYNELVYNLFLEARFAHGRRRDSSAAIE